MRKKHLEKPLRTPLFDLHLQKGAKCIDFGGWEMPVQYTGIIQEHEQTRQRTGIFDIGHMGEFMVRGKSAGKELDRLVSSMPSTLKNGKCRYGLMLNEKGGVIDDTIVYRFADDEFMLVVNAGTRVKDLQHIGNVLSKEVSVEDISMQTGKIDIQGPTSIEVVKEVCDFDVSLLKYFSFQKDGQLLVSRTGYTGELGVEIYANYSEITELWKKLLEHEQVAPIGLGARDTLRLESGYALYGHELDEETPAVYCGVDRFLNFDNDFIGKETLLSLKDDPEYTYVGFKSANKSAPRAEEKICLNDEIVGIVTSGSLSPSLGVGIGVGRVLTSALLGQTSFEIDKGRRRLQVEICEVPFYQGTVRKKLSV